MMGDAPRNQPEHDAELDALDRRTTKLEHAVFGVNERGGILDRLEALDSRLARVHWALVTAAITFGVGSVAGVVTTLSQ